MVKRLLHKAWTCSKGSWRAFLKEAQLSYKINKESYSSEASHSHKNFFISSCGRMWINKSFLKDDCLKPQDHDKLGASQFDPFIGISWISINEIRMDLSRHLKNYPMIHVSHKMSYVVQLEDIGPVVNSRSNELPTIKKEEHDVDRNGSQRKRSRIFQFVTLIEVNNHHDAARQHKTH